jgi:hypothetical protein
MAGRAVQREAGNLVSVAGTSFPKISAFVKWKSCFRQRADLRRFPAPQAGFRKPDKEPLCPIYPAVSLIPIRTTTHSAALCCRSETSSAAYYPASVCHLRYWPEYSVVMRVAGMARQHHQGCQIHAAAEEARREDISQGARVRTPDTAER